MGERSGSLGNGGFDTGFFYLGLVGVPFLIRVPNFIKVASQSVFVCKDEHIALPSCELASGLCNFWRLQPLVFGTLKSFKHWDFGLWNNFMCLPKCIYQWDFIVLWRMDLSSRSKSRFFDSGIFLRRKGISIRKIFFYLYLYRYIWVNG